LGHVASMTSPALDPFGKESSGFTDGRLWG
jgi:hypothetical protein